MITATIVLPNLNHARYLECSLERLTKQTFNDYEILVFDDGSTDNSVDIIEKYKELNPQINLIKRDKTIGVVKNLNAGLQMARGEYIYFASSDDYVNYEFLEESLFWLKKYPDSALSMSCAVVFNDENKITGLRPIIIPSLIPGYISSKQTRKLLKTGDNYFVGTVALYRTYLVRKLGGFDSDLGSLSDSMLARRLALRYGFCFIPRIIGGWRVHGNNYSSNSITDIEQLTRIISQARAVIEDDTYTRFPENYDELLSRRLRFGSGRIVIEDESNIKDSNYIKKLVFLCGDSEIDSWIITGFVHMPFLAKKLLLFWLFIRLRPYSFMIILVEPIRKYIGLKIYKYFY